MKYVKICLKGQFESNCAAIMALESEVKTQHSILVPRKRVKDTDFLFTCTLNGGIPEISICIFITNKQVATKGES